MLLIIYISVTVIQFVFLLGVFHPLKEYKNKVLVPKYHHFQPISILVIVKNEVENLKKLIPILLSQRYSGLWDIHIIDDHSSDGTAEELMAQSALHPNLYVHHLSDHGISGKKQGLEFGLSVTNYTYVLLTDADCRPASTQWLALMQSRLECADIVLGYSPYLMEDTWLNRTIRLETNYTALLYLGMAMQGHAYMGVGRNMLYPKSLVLTNSVLKKHSSLLSGDDDLTINALSLNHTMAIQLDPESFVESIPKKTWKSWLHQKSRHVSTARFYQLQHILILGLFYTSMALSWVLPVFLFWYYPYILVLVVVFKLSYYFTLNYLFINTLKNKFSLMDWLGAEVLYLLSLVYLLTSSIYKKPSTW